MGSKEGKLGHTCEFFIGEIDLTNACLGSHLLLLNL